MRVVALAMAAAIALSPMAASATSVTPIDTNQITIGFDSVGPDVNLGALDLALAPIAINGLFGGTNVDGSLTFGIFSSAPLPAAAGSLDVNIIADNETFSGTLGGNPLTFVPVLGDFVASFSLASLPSDAGSATQFVFDFAGFDRGDQFQVNVGVIPLPASLPLLFGALGALGLMARRRRKLAAA